jgi:hypothetical protein
VLLSSVVGLVVLGDQVAAGRGSWVGAGLALVVFGVIVMAVVQPHEPLRTRVRVTTRPPADPAPEGVVTR